MKAKIAARYIGPGYHNGIPMRDLDVDDWFSLSAEQQETIKISSIYQYRPVASTGSVNEELATGGAEKPATK
jgi:hypothetical protein